MSSPKPTLLVALVLLPAGAFADGYVLGMGVDRDSADGRAITAFGDLGVGEKIWFSMTANSAQTKGFIRNNDTLYASVSLDHWFEPAGVRLGGSYWGNADILDSRDLRASIYLRGDPGSISLEYEKRNFKFDLQSDRLRGRTATFSADGWGFTTHIALGERVSIHLGGMAYDYSRNIRVQQDIDVLAFVTNSRLSMIHSLIDDRFNAGVEFEFGLKSIDLSVSQWRASVDGSKVKSYGLGFLTPISDRVDAEFRIAFDDSETFGNTTSLSFYLYYFGGM